MSKARVITGSLLAILVLTVVLFMRPLGSAALLAVVALLAGWEWAGFAGLETPAVRVAYSLLLNAVLLPGGWFAAAGPALVPVLVVGCAWWVLACGWVVSYQRRGGPLPGGRTGLTLIAVVALGPALAALLFLLNGPIEYLLALFCVVWGADIFAYFGGRRFGRRKLASRVSPGKTWEGVFSALAVLLILALGAAAVWAPALLPLVLGLTLVTAAASVVGDLFESLVKRSRGVKDSGSLLPGHGGVLDRIDGLVAAAPVFALGVASGALR